MAEPSLEGLIEANAAFYKLLKASTFMPSGRLNMASEGDVCVHPGWRPLSGWADIEHSWQGIFEHTTYMQIVPSEVNAHFMAKWAGFLVLKTSTALLGLSACSVRWWPPTSLSGQRTAGSWFYTMAHLFFSPKRTLREDQRPRSAPDARLLPV